MRNNKIAVKLFLVTSVVFVLFISVTLVFQILFFQKYYISKKIDNFTENLKSFSSTISTETLNQEIATEKFKKFDASNNSLSAILNITQFNYHMTNGTLQLDQQYMLYAFDKKVNSSIIPLLIKEWINTSQSKYHNYIFKDKKTLIYQKTLEDTNYIVGVSPIVKNGKVDNIIFSLVSLQPVGDAVDTLRSFYVYIYIFAIVLIFILSMLYSIMISKPLVKLKKTASKMTELDFTTVCDVKSKDEIGELGGILNFLSEKLGKTLGELKDSNEKLKADIEKERQLEIMRKEFVAGVSHELKTPLTLISGYAEALKDDIVEAKDKEFFVDVILDESRKMDYLIKDMLDLSQLETGNLMMNFEEFNICDVLNFVLKKFSINVMEKNVVLETMLCDNCTLVTGDINRIEQVLVNLISNAMKYVSSGGVIKVIIEKIGEELIISVENEGQHIPEEEFEKIWERFYKIDKSRNREALGTGIGLSIVKNILLLHESNFGAINTELGVKFYFSLKQA